MVRFSEGPLPCSDGQLLCVPYLVEGCESSLGALFYNANPIHEALLS